MYSLLRAALAIAVLLITACSEQPKPGPAANENASSSSASSTPISGKKAFWEMYKSAYSWSNDLVPLKLESKELAGVKNDGGNAGMWVATFGSFRKHQALVITYAVAAQPPEIYKGINVGHPITWAGPASDATPFQTSDLVTDSDAVYKTALAQAQPWLAKHPDKQASFLLGNNPTRFSTPVWYVLWGDSKSGYGVFVNSKTGDIAKPGK